MNILLALTDVGPGDGGTLVVPGSHKTSFVPEEVTQLYRDKANDTKGQLPWRAVEVHLEAALGPFQRYKVPVKTNGTHISACLYRKSL